MKADYPSALGPGRVVLFMTEVNEFGGAERSFLAMARWLHQHGFDVELLTYFDRCDIARIAGFPLRVVALQPVGGVRAKVRALRKYFADWQGAPPLVSGYQPALHISLAGVRRFHCLMHDTPALFAPAEDAGWKGRLRLALSNVAIRYGFRVGANQMIVTSEFLQRDCWRNFHVKAEIARMGGFGASSGFERRRVESALHMLSVCRIEGNKRIDWMLDALAELERGAVPLSARVDWRLDLAGKGSLLTVLRARAEELGLGSRVHFHGFVSDESLQEMYGRAHLFLMPAVQGYGIPAIEALERGIPVVLHRESGVSDLLLHTPWAAVLHGGRKEMEPKLAGMVEWLLRNKQMSCEPPPRLPTEDEWAERVSQLCGYVSPGVNRTV